MTVYEGTGPESGRSTTAFELPGSYGHWAARLGDRIAVGIGTREPVLAGGERLYTLGGQPPGPWTLNVWEGR